MKKLSLSHVAMNNLKHQAKRSILLVILLSLLSFTLLTSIIISLNLKNGIETMSARFGADLMVVPSDSTSNMENILLQGEPSSFYFSKELLNEIKDIDGIKEVTSQFYLQSLSAGCCSAPLQIIGYDPNTDFSIIPWISEAKSGKIAKDELIIGANITPDKSNTLKLFGTEYKIAAQLDETGTGLDNSVYADISMIPQLREDAIKQGVEFETNENPKESVSAILVNVKDESKREKVINDIYIKAADSNITINVIESQTLTQDISKNVGNMSAMLYIYAGLFVVTVYMTLYIVFSLITNERKKEFAIMRIIGAKKGTVSKIMLIEASTISFAGGLIGSTISLVISLSFGTLIKTRLGLPYMNASVAMILAAFFISTIITTVIGPLAALATISKINKAETFITMKEGD